MSRHLSTCNISSKSMHAFLSNLANRQTDRQTNERVQTHLPPPLSEVNNYSMCHTPTVETTVFQLHLLEILDFAARQTIADIQIFKYFTKVVLPTIISRFLQLNLYATLKDCPNLSLSHAVQIKENMKDAAGYKKSCRAKDRPWSFVVTTGTLCNGYTRHDWTRRQGGTRPWWPRRVSE